MATLFDRELLLNAGGLIIGTRSTEIGTFLERKDTLRSVFRVEKTLSREPNTAQLSIYNLNEENRQFLATSEKISTAILVGYTGFISQIFLGELEYGSSVRQGTDWITTIQSQDGTSDLSANRISASFKKIKIGELMSDLTNKLQSGVGNLIEKARTEGGTDDVLGNGVVLNGLVFDELDNVCKRLGLEVSIQDGQALALKPQETIGEGSTLLRAPDEDEEGTGLIGTPEPGEKGFVNVRTLIQPGILPGHAIEVDSKSVSGLYRVERVVFVGDTWGNDWYAEIEGKPIS